MSSGEPAPFLWLHPAGEAADLRVLAGPADNRLHLGRLVRLGDRPTNNDIVLEQFPRTETGALAPEHRAEVLSRWRALKGERNFLTIALISEAWGHVVRTRNAATERGSDLGLFSPYEPDTPLMAADLEADTLFTLSTAVSRTLSDAFYETTSAYETRLSGLPEDQLTQQDRDYQRLDAIRRFGNRNGIIQFDTVAEFLESGVIFAGETLWGIVSAIPRTFQAEQQRSIIQQEFIAVLRNSRSLAVQLASGHRVRAVSLVEALRTSPDGTRPRATDTLNAIVDRFDIRHLTITQGAHPVLAVQRNALETLTLPLTAEEKRLIQQGVAVAAQLIQNANLHDVTTRCPAMYARGVEDNVIVELYDWIADLAAKGFIPQFPESLPQQ